MNVTPMMKQYLEIKEQYKDCLLFFRLGDFYEMFFEDAITASRELEITLTGRDCGLEERAPMCGVPYHAADNYIARLVEKGYKVAICEQVEDPSTAKGIVKREIVRIVTPGTLLEGNALKQEQNNYLVSIVSCNDQFGLSVADITTGEWSVTHIDSENGIRKLMDELSRFSPSECIMDSQVYEINVVKEFLLGRLNCKIERIPDFWLDFEGAKKLLMKHFKVSALQGLGLDDNKCLILASSCLLRYLQETQKNSLSHMNHINIYHLDAYMLLDIATRRNLELTETLREKKRKGSLVWVLDHTKTAMGARFLRKCIEQPLINEKDINARLDAVSELKENGILRSELMEALDRIYDIERLMSKVSYGTCNAKDLISLKQSLSMLPQIHLLLSSVKCDKLKEIHEKFDTLNDIYSLLEESIANEPPVTVREGNIIKDGYDNEVDRLRKIKREGTDWLVDIEAKEKNATGIKSLKIKYNKVFGYFLEVTNSYANLVPDYFIRKQTLANCERYVTEELKKVEEEILGADDKLTQLEYKIFQDIRQQIMDNIGRILMVSNQIAEIDTLCSLADVAHQNNYVRPDVNLEKEIHIKEGRHPVIEKILGEHAFISNDVYLNNDTHQIILLTGPNMAGKSTYMRQVALIVLMAQIGSFVPATQAQIGIVDRIFTRVGASDDLASGQSTFMVEMMEVSHILHNATSNSLLILDEVGRGTSTLDGLSIAWSILEHLSSHKHIGAKTLFATHYHELTDLEEKLPNLKNFCVSVKEVGEDIIFLHKIVKGSIDHSYGIEVAKLAGIPEDVLNRAKEIMKSLESEKKLVPSDKKEDLPKPSPIKKEKTAQLSLFEEQNSKVIETLKQLDIMELTPLKALQILYDLQKQVR